MGKYTPLESCLRAIPTSQRELTLGFVQIERILNDKLPPSAIFIRHAGRTKQKERLMLNHSHGWRQAGELTQQISIQNGRAFGAQNNNQSIISIHFTWRNGMSSTAFKELEEKYPEIVKKMPDEFNSHFFILTLAQKYQRLYVQALNEYVKNDQPFESVHKEIAKRLKNHKDLVKYLYTRSSKNIFGHENGAAVWKKVKK